MIKGIAAGLLSLLCLPALLAASIKSFDAYRSGYGWARPAGAGGAWAAAPLSLEALYENPAGLPVESTQLLFAGGLESSRGWQGGLQLSTPIDSGLRMAFGLSQDLIAQPLSGMESTYSLGLGLDLDAASSAGLRLDYQRLDEGTFSVSGFNMDFGLRRAQKLPWRDHQLVVGGVIQNAITSWPDRNWAKTQTSSWRAGMAWNWRGHGSLGAEWQAPRELEGLPAEPIRVKLGTEWRWGDWTGRAGLGDSARERWSAGAGWTRGLSGLGLQYALLGGDSGSLRHRVELAWVFKATRMLEAPVETREIAVNKQTGNIEKARLTLETPDRRDVKSWRLDIRDKKGNLVRTLEGQGDPPRELVWDGKDGMGLAVKFDEGLVYKLSLRGPEDAILASARVLHTDLELAPNWELSSLGDLPVELVGDVPFETLPEKRLELSAAGFASGSIWTLSLLEPSLSSLPVGDDGTALAATRYETIESKRLELATEPDPEGGRVWWLELVEPALSSLPMDDSLFKNWAEGSKDAGPPQGRFELAAAVDSRGRSWSLELSDPKLVVMLVVEPTAEPTPAPLQASASLSRPSPTIRLRARFSPIRLARSLAPNPARSRRVRQAVAASSRPWQGSGAVWLDIFLKDSDALDPSKKAILEGALLRFKGGSGKRLKLTGLVSKRESGGASLSRARALRFSTWLSEEAGFNGDFVIQVVADAGLLKGVRVESVR